MMQTRKLYLLWFLGIISLGCQDQLRTDSKSVSSQSAKVKEVFDRTPIQNSTSFEKSLLTSYGSGAKERLGYAGIDGDYQSIKDLRTRKITVKEIQSISQSRIVTADVMAEIQNLNYAIILPTNEAEQKAVFESYKKNDLDMYRDIEKQVLKANNPNIKIIKSELELTTWMKKSEDKPFVIAGHSVRGVIPMPDGNQVSIQTLEQAAAEKESQVLFLTCDGNPFTKNPAPGYKLTFPDANILANQYDEILSKAAKNGKGEINEQIEKQLLKFKIVRNLNKKVKMIVVGAGLVELVKELSSGPLDGEGDPNRVNVVRKIPSLKKIK